MKKPIVIGLTGNYASGKSHVAEVFRGFNIPVQDSDKVAHQVLESEAFEQIKSEFPTAIENGKINRQLLGAQVFGNDSALKKLESIVHPLVRKRNLQFIKDNSSSEFILLEIPLLFEAKAEAICDYVVFIDISREIQQSRALARPGMSPEKLKKILSAQEKISVEEKKKRANFVLDNEPGADTLHQVKLILEEIKQTI